MAMAFPQLAFMPIAGVIEKKNSSFGKPGISKIYNRRRIAGLQTIIACYNLQCAPGFSIVTASLQNNFDISKISRTINPSFAKRQQVTIWRFDDGRNTKRFVSFGA